MKKIIISTVLFLGFTGVVFAITPNSILTSRIAKVTAPSEVVDDTSFVKNDDGTVSKIEHITRTTVINISEVTDKKVSLQAQLDSVSQQETQLKAIKVGQSLKATPVLLNNL